MQTDIIGHVNTKLQIMLFLDMSQINKCLVILNGQPVPATMLEICSEVAIYVLGLGNITILLFIVIIKCHNYRYRRDFSVL